MTTQKKASAEAKLHELGLQLPNAPAAAAAYVTFVRSGNFAFTSGHLPVKMDGTRMVGRLGTEMAADQGIEAAKLTALNLLATIKANLGSLDKVKRVVKIVGLINSSPDFTDLAKVMNGCSDLMAQVFGDAGKHVRVTAGVASLPFNVPIEIDVTLEVE